MLTLSLLHGWWDTNPAELHVICVATWKTRATACPYAMPYSRMVAVASLKGRQPEFPAVPTTFQHASKVLQEVLSLMASCPFQSFFT